MVSNKCISLYKGWEFPRGHCESNLFSLSKGYLILPVDIDSSNPFYIPSLETLFKFYIKFLYSKDVTQLWSKSIWEKKTLKRKSIIDLQHFLFLTHSSHNGHFSSHYSDSLPRCGWQEEGQDPPLRPDNLTKMEPGVGGDLYKAPQVSVLLVG